MDRAAVQARIDAIPWYHEFDFGNGLAARSGTTDVDGHRQIWDFIHRGLDRIDFRGKSVLDVGCWDGYWSFEAERRGATAILAADDFSQNWSAPDGLFLARELLNSKVEVSTDQSVYELDRMDRQFDVVMLLGVFYHLHDPLYAFAQLRHRCRPGATVVLEGNVTYGLPPHALLWGSPFGNSRFTPSPAALDELLRAAYLRPVWTEYLHPEVKPKPVTPPAPAEDTSRIGWRWRLRMAAAALRGSRPGVRAAADELLPPPAPTIAPPPAPLKPDSRVLLICEPMAEANPLHPYRPPFGLDRYDPRFAEKVRRAA